MDAPQGSGSPTVLISCITSKVALNSLITPLLPFPNFVSNDPPLPPAALYLAVKKATLDTAARMTLSTSINAALMHELLLQRRAIAYGRYPWRA